MWFLICVETCSSVSAGNCCVYKVCSWKMFRFCKHKTHFFQWALVKRKDFIEQTHWYEDCSNMLLVKTCHINSPICQDWRHSDEGHSYWLKSKWFLNDPRDCGSSGTSIHENCITSQRHCPGTRTSNISTDSPRREQWAIKGTIRYDVRQGSTHRWTLRRGFLPIADRESLAISIFDIWRCSWGWETWIDN